ncbi:proline-rich nuclear receptor coactivator 2-like [Ptychodera flava]|uniref:proline-rich nuclear receptor coactivator 2-like n=1 Tax=Ptychodera flava TaxID=63121 RepID=UPI003969D185
MTPGSSPSTSTRNIQNRRGGNTPKKYRDRNSNTPSPKPCKSYNATPNSRASPRTTADVQNNNRVWSCLSTPNRQSPKPSTVTNSNNESPYAGAKFSDPPSPKLLPKPPTHWVESMKTRRPSIDNDIVAVGVNECDLMTCQLKMMLKVTA